MSKDGYLPPGVEYHMIPGMDERVDYCRRCGEELTGENMVDDDPDSPCMDCMQARADIIHDQMKDME